MSRVRHIPASELSADIAGTYERFAAYGPFANQVAVMAHVPSALTHLMGLLMELKAQRNVRWRYVEPIGFLPVCETIFPKRKLSSLL